MNQDKQNPKSIPERLGWLKTNRPEEALQVHRDRQLRQSIEILNDLVNQNAHRPESIHLLRKILRERSELKIVTDSDQSSLSG